MRACLLILLLLMAPTATARTVIERVTVLTMTAAGALADHDVTVDGDRIVGLAPHDPAMPAGARRRIDGQGMVLMPGLIEMHGHVPSPEQEPVYTDDVLFLFVARGVTTVRGMLGQPGHLALRERIRREHPPAPTLYLAGPGFSRNVGDSVGAVLRVEQQAAEGWDLLKIFNGLTLVEFDALAARARQLGIPFGGHVPQAVGVERALAAGMRTIDHLDGYIEALQGEATEIPEATLRDIARRTKVAGTGVVPTMDVWDHLLGVTPIQVLENRDELAYLPATVREPWLQQYRSAQGARDRLAAGMRRLLGGRDVEMISHNRRRLLKVMDQEGVEILFGADTPQFFVVPGFSAYHEAMAMQAAGISRARILASATVIAGAYFAASDRFGVIVPGARADLLLLGGNPLDSLEALRDVRGVAVRGRWLDGGAIAQGLTDIRHRAR